MHEKYGVDENDFILALTDVLDKARKPGVEDSFELWKPHLTKLGLSLDREEFFNFWFSGEKLVPELLDYAKKLTEKGIKVFILSNNFRERTEYYRKNFPQIFTNIDGAYFSWETGFVKPDPEAYLNLLKEHGFKPGECLYFDDNEKNLKVAQELGFWAQKWEGLESIKKSPEKKE